VKFLLDHDVPDALSYLLRELGHDVSLLRKVIPTDAPDPAVLQFANDNQAVLVTCNRDDFIELANHHDTSRHCHRHSAEDAGRRTCRTVSTVAERR
jgi:predicted nuclease of predicted toxin-antitoxin system